MKQYPNPIKFLFILNSNLNFLRRNSSNYLHTSHTQNINLFEHINTFELPQTPYCLYKPSESLYIPKFHQLDKNIPIDLKTKFSQSSL